MTAAPAWAQQYVPPDRSLPGRREGGGTRGSCIASQPTLTALMPDSNYGTTTHGYPTLFWYVPETTAPLAEFELLDENNQPIYTTQFAVTGKSGLISLSLPATATLPPLSVGTPYHWYFSLVCDRQDRSGDVMTEGWIERISLDPALNRQLQAASESDRAMLYAQAGSWYDALATLMTLHCSQPNDAAIVTKWQTLLDSVGLTITVDDSYCRNQE